MDDEMAEGEARRRRSASSSLRSEQAVALRAIVAEQARFERRTK
jgi:hypothetical protein